MFSGLCCYKHCYHRLYIHMYLCPCTNVSTGCSPTSRLEGSKGLQTFTCLLENFSSYDSCSIPVILLQFLQQCTLLSFLVFNVIVYTTPGAGLACALFYFTYLKILQIIGHLCSYFFSEKSLPFLYIG